MTHEHSAPHDARVPVTMAVFPLTLHLPAPLWLALPALAPKSGATTVILRAVEESVAATGKRLDARGTVRAGLSAIPRQGTHGPSEGSLRTQAGSRVGREGGAQWTNCSRRYPCRSLRSALPC